MLIALLRTLWRLSYHDMHDWLRDWPALALACGLPLARPLLAWAVHLYHIRPRIIRLDAGYWGLCLIAWIHSALGAVAVVPWNRHSPEEPLLLTSDLEAREELGKRSAIERFFGRVFLFFHLQRPSLCGWSAIARQVALTYTATILDSIVCDHYKGHFLTNPLCNFCVK